MLEVVRVNDPKLAITDLVEQNGGKGVSLGGILSAQVADIQACGKLGHALRALSPALEALRARKRARKALQAPQGFEALREQQQALQDAEQDLEALEALQATGRALQLEPFKARKNAVEAHTKALNDLLKNLLEHAAVPAELRVEVAPP